ncbi:IS21 family transposase [Thiolapillus sp.]|uniref:IS21 family transposase n=1 Tax=Thiolapillus sp. TaxID=2017437 RepID=UPI003AF60B21
MSIDKETETKIIRYHFVEQWRVGTIATQLGIHHSVVDRVLSQAGLPKVERSPRASIIDPYLPFIVATLKQFPTLTAARLYEMAKQRGYPGGPSQFRQRISQLRPRRQPEAYLRLKTLPGEQGQVDWGHFGHLQIGRAKRPLMAFVMVLSWSRQIFLRYAQMENFLRGHVAAFEAWQGLPKVLLYDNLKSAVLERRGDAIRFHPTLLALSAHYRFEPRPVAVARGNEKGRVERAIRYIRDNFFAGRQWRTLEELNAQAEAWCQGVSAERRCPENNALTVEEAFLQEQPQLLALPDNPFDTAEQKVVSARKTPYIRFDRNDYSIPHQQVQKPLTVQASLSTVCILDGDERIAEHPRSFDQGRQIELEDHINALWLEKTNARLHRGQDRLSQASASIPDFLQQSVDRGHVLKTTVRLLNEFLDHYGREELHAAVTEALEQQSPYPQAVQQILERRREEKQQPPPVAVAVPDKVRAINVKTADIAAYDNLYASTDSEEVERDTGDESDLEEETNAAEETNLENESGRGEDND